MDSVTEENVDKLNKDYSEKINILEKLKSTTIHMLWLNELEILIFLVIIILSCISYFSNITHF